MLNQKHTNGSGFLFFSPLASFMLVWVLFFLLCFFFVVVAVISPRHYVIVNECAAEFLGTFIILFIGNASGGAGQLGKVTGALEYGMTWGFAVTAAILASGKA